MKPIKLIMEKYETSPTHNRFFLFIIVYKFNKFTLNTQICGTLDIYYPTSIQ